MATETPKNDTDSNAPTASSSVAKIEAIYITRRSTEPMESKQSARLIPGRGIEGDRYALGTGTYSAKFFGEPGKNLTMVSLDGIVEATKQTKGMKPFHRDNIAELRRNIVLSGISAEALNDTIGHEVRIGASGCRVFVHRRTVPCKYREAQCRRPGLMNRLWDCCGVNCEILPPLKKEADDNDNTIEVGDTVAVIPNTYQPKRVDVGWKPPEFFIRPADRTPEQHKKFDPPPFLVGLACLWDPEGFQRAEDAYQFAGTRLWSPKAYSTGLFVKSIRTPLIATVSVGLLSIAIAVVFRLNGI